MIATTIEGKIPAGPIVTISGPRESLQKIRDAIGRAMETGGSIAEGFQDEGLKGVVVHVLCSDAGDAVMASGFDENLAAIAARLMSAEG